MKYNILIIVLFLITSCQPKHDVPETINLHDNWQFKAVNDSVWIPATVPGNVHSDLLENNHIKNPFIGNNEDGLQWISKTDWEYKTNFLVDKKTLNKQHIELNFEGLDTYASVFLNDSLILESHNAFRTFSIDVKSALKPKNELRIVFKHTSVSEDHKKNKLSYQLPEGHRIFTRKAQFQYGWDWAPKLNTSGIWRPVSLKAWNSFKIEDIYIQSYQLTNEEANIGVNLRLKNQLKTPLDYFIYVNNQLHQTYENIGFHNTPDFNLTIKNPKRWWPHNLGNPYLYDIEVVVKNNHTILDRISIKKGLRTIELVTEKDSIGESFYFKVNDVPVYMKGANYIPQNSMQNKVTIAHYEKLLNDVVDANMNMLRVWGGGIYENDIFYDLCDEKGILVWQDFMFACGMYPGDKQFKDNVLQEAIENVKRLRNHASIALWCGNNENSEGWHRWGWQDGFSESEKEDIWNDYEFIFKKLLPTVIKNTTEVPYWESSPKFGRGNPKYKTEGDAHDWWIWHDGYPFEHLENNVPRFMSEFGFQSFPTYETIQYINQSDALEITSEGFKNHQKHSRGFDLINAYMQRDFPVPHHPEDYVYVSQLLQAYGITRGIEAHRRAKPYNMGTLYWQLNDCWPAVSWSSIDYFGHWKALHYQAKKSFKNILISSEINNTILKTFIINDGLKGITSSLQIKIIDFNGNQLWSSDEQIYASGNSSAIKHELNIDTLGIDKKGILIISKFSNSTSFFYLAKPKDLKLKKAPITQKITKTKNGFQITLKSTTLQKNVFLYTVLKGHFSDNYFDLLPNTSVTIEFETKAVSLEDLKIKTLNDLLL
ncbi:glycosyl hydrolase 2 galactose-binding domain-containing protein [Psychroserpens mesophilus]|uniref:beta-mannosidase n=1 Tax=Psychroserpens mesophilus TaxID=325473 RepID=UPI003D645ADD